MPKEKSRKTAKKPNPLKPGMIVLAAVLLWSAKNEPAQFDITSLGTWALGAILVALLVRAALALVDAALRPPRRHPRPGAPVHARQRG